MEINYVIRVIQDKNGFRKKRYISLDRYIPDPCPINWVPGLVVDAGNFVFDNYHLENSVQFKIMIQNTESNQYKISYLEKRD